MIANVYQSLVHVIARRDVKVVELQDISRARDLRLGMGLEGTGTHIFVEGLLRHAIIDDKAILKEARSFAHQLDLLDKDKLDVAFFVTGRGLEPFKRLSSHKLRFVTWDDESIKRLKKVGRYF